MTISVAKEANALASDNRACSNGRSGENKHGSSKGSGTRTEYGGSSQTRPLCHGNRQGEELFCLWGFGHMARHCRNCGRGRGVAENRRVEYGGGRIEEIISLSDNLKEGENLELLN